MLEILFKINFNPLKLMIMAAEVEPKLLVVVGILEGEKDTVVDT